MTSRLDHIFMTEFVQGIDQREKYQKNKTFNHIEICERKQTILSVIEDFLKKFVDCETVVFRFIPGIFYNHEKIEKFSFSWEDSSPTWSPGVSIVFSHPVLVEIAVGNYPDDEKIIIHVSETHPDSHIISKKYEDPYSACEDLAKFILKNTVSIGKKIPQVDFDNVDFSDNDDKTINTYFGDDINE